MEFPGAVIDWDGASYLLTYPRAPGGHVGIRSGRKLPAFILDYWCVSMVLIRCFGQPWAGSDVSILQMVCVE